MITLDSIKDAIVPLTPAGLQEQSRKVLSLFEKAANDLKDINSKIAGEQGKRQEVIDRSMKEIDELEVVLKQNSKVINNINNIIS